MNEFDILRRANIARNVEYARRMDTGEPVQIPIIYRAMELAGEVGELLNVIKKMERENLGIAASRASMTQLVQEIGDVQICLDLLCMDLRVSIWSATINTFNRKSEEMHLKTFIKPRGE